ncbi:hypothetical protein PMAYCL1PPCAC_22936, partial [Pristionchus mayeri]
YHSCCCGAHVVTLSRVFIVISLVFDVLDFANLSSPFGIIVVFSALFIDILGAVSIFQELRMPLCVFICLTSIHLPLSVLHGVISLASDPENQGKGGAILMTTVILFIVALPIFITYYNMSQFLKDREKAQQVPTLYTVQVHSPIPAAPAAAEVLSVHSTTTAPSYAPPPYDEKCRT